MAAEDDRAAPAHKPIDEPITGAAAVSCWVALAVVGFIAWWALWCGSVALYHLLSTLVR